MIKNNRFQQILLENSFMSPEVVLKMEHSDYQVIDLEQDLSKDDSDHEVDQKLRKYWTIKLGNK